MVETHHNHKAKSVGSLNGALSKSEPTIGQQIKDVSQIIGEIIVVQLKILFYYILSIYHAIVPVTEKPVKGEIVLITGTGHGIGKQLALRYASEGATVVAWDIDEKNNADTAKEISSKGYPKPYTYRVDVSKREDVLRAAKKVQEEVGDVTILINNAGIMPTRPLFEQTTEEIERIMNINVMAHFSTLEAFLPAMIKHNHGHVVALSSVAGMVGIANLVPYCASKFAVRGMMQALYEELNENPNNRIGFTTIMPYMVDTGLCKRPYIKFKSLMKMLTPDEVAQGIMHAQRTDLVEVTLPRYFYNLNNWVRVMPIKAALVLKNFIGSGVLSDK